MKNVFFLLISLTFLTLSCDKENEGKTELLPEVKYEVLTSSGEWYGEWFDENGNRVKVLQAPFNKSGWTITFRPKALPFDLFCSANSTCCPDQTKSDVTVNLYIDGVLIQSATNNWSKGVTSALYKLTK